MCGLRTSRATEMNVWGPNPRNRLGRAVAVISEQVLRDCSIGGVGKLIDAPPPDWDTANSGHWWTAFGSELMRRIRRRIGNLFRTALFTVSFALAATTARSDILFESGTLGPTGVTFADLENGTVPGTNVNKFVFAGVRFELTQPVITTQVGGHFVEEVPGTFFGAIVALDDAGDFPNSADLSTADVLGATTPTYPNPSAEVLERVLKIRIGG